MLSVMVKLFSIALTSVEVIVKACLFLRDASCRPRERVKPERSLSKIRGDTIAIVGKCSKGITGE
jgi:hypothetical protein